MGLPKTCFRKGHIPWNKGTRKAKQYYDNQRKQRRANEDYYLYELKRNADRIRSNKMTKKRELQIQEKRKEYARVTVSQKRNKHWTIEDEIFLEENYQTMTFLEIALILDRTWIAVNKKANKMKLRKYHNWKQE